MRTEEGMALPVKSKMQGEAVFLLSKRSKIE